MLVFIEKNLVFLSMPKTASTAFIAALTPYASMIIKSPPGVKHMNLRRFDNRLRPLIEKNQSVPIETLAVIRHPLDWLGSWYRYRQRNAIKTHQTPRKMSALIPLCRRICAKLQPILPKSVIRQNFYSRQKSLRHLLIYFNMKINQDLSSFLNSGWRLHLSWKIETYRRKKPCPTPRNRRTAA